MRREQARAAETKEALALYWLLTIFCNRPRSTGATRALPACRPLKPPQASSPGRATACALHPARSAASKATGMAQPPPRYQTLQLSVGSDGVAVLRLARASKSNAFDACMWEELPQVCSLRGMPLRREPGSAAPGAWRPHSRLPLAGPRVPGRRAGRQGGARQLACPQPAQHTLQSTPLVLQPLSPPAAGAAGGHRRRGQKLLRRHRCRLPGGPVRAQRSHGAGRVPGAAAAGAAAGDTQDAGRWRRCAAWGRAWMDGSHSGLAWGGGCS